MNKEGNKIKKNLIIILYIIIIVLGCIRELYIYKVLKELEQRKVQEESKIFKEIKQNYNNYVEVINDAPIYIKVDDEYIRIGLITKEAKLILEEKEIKDYNDIYFKLKNTDYYISYENVAKIEEFNYDDIYKNYIPFNNNVVTANNTKLYSDNGYAYYIKEGINLPLIINDNDKYYVEYDSQLMYVNKSDADLTDNHNTDAAISNDIPVILYHYVCPENDKSCSGIIYHSIDQVSQHFNYLKENNYYTMHMKDMELWVDGKINLPSNSVLITIDDGWYVDEMQALLIKYDLHATLFMITSLYENPNVYTSKYIETHSHTDNMHYTGACSGGQGSPIKCLDRNKILTDLKLSREKLNGTTYFSWPFYEYNDYSINLLKEAGFNMGFIGLQIKATRGDSKLLIPRITIHNTTTLQQFINYVK